MAEVVVVSLEGHSTREGDEPSLRDVDDSGAVARGSPQDNPMSRIAAVTRTLLEPLFEYAEITRRIIRVRLPVGLDGGRPPQVQRTCLIRTS